MGVGYSVLLDGTEDPDLSTAEMVEVIEQVGQPTEFYLRYPVNATGGDLLPLTDARLGPGADLAVLVKDGDASACLAHGLVRGAQIHLVHGSDGSYLDVVGGDMSIRMDRTVVQTHHADVTDADIVRALLGTYGLEEGAVETTQALHSVAKHTLLQHETDLALAQRLARRNGFLFWVRTEVEGGLLGAELKDYAYFAPPNLDTSDVPELVINFPDESNLLAIDLEWDVERPTMVSGAQLDLLTLDTFQADAVAAPETFPDDIPLSAINAADEARSLALAPPVDEAGDLLARRAGALQEASWFLRASCTTTYGKVGRLVRAPGVVHLRGAGSRYSGYYFVERVRHTLDAAAHHMEISLVRNGWRQS